MTDLTNTAIQDVLRGILGAVAQKQSDAANRLSDLPAAQKAVDTAKDGDFEGFNFSVLHPIGEAIDGFLAAAIPTSEAARFLMREQAFVERHFRRMIAQIEGSSCSADKAYAVMRGLFHFLVHGERIVFDASEQYTFHHPKVIFTTHEQIVGFFEALRELYYARPERYIRAVEATLRPKAGGTGFKVGDPVQWKSQAGGYIKSKAGIVAEVVPPMASPRNKGDGWGSPRNHESYVVKVGTKLYWPVARNLRFATCVEGSP